MRDFIYFSQKAWTSGNFTDLMRAGRMDIAIHFLINSLFISRKIRDNVRVHLIFYGPPDPPKHLTFFYHPDIPISKRDVAGLIKRMLFKYKGEGIQQIYPGCLIDKKNFYEVIEDLKKEGKKIYILDKSGKDIEKTELDENGAFIIGDHKGLPKKETRRLKEECEIVSLGKKTYFASHVVTIINYILDRKEENV